MLLGHQTTDKLSGLRFIGCHTLGPFSFPSNTCLRNEAPANFSALHRTRLRHNLGPSLFCLASHPDPQTGAETGQFSGRSQIAISTKMLANTNSRPTALCLFFASSMSNSIFSSHLAQIQVLPWGDSSSFYSFR
jgi:hypothetical protein